MADDVLFNVDASQIIVKLHFAGLQATRDGQKGGAFFVNTGIKDDDPKGTPEKIGKTAFDLKNSSNTYQFGYIVPITYTYGGNNKASLDDLSKDVSDVIDIVSHMDKDSLLKPADKDKKNIETIDNKSKSIIELCKDNGIKLDDGKTEITADKFNFKDSDQLKKLNDIIDKAKSDNKAANAGKSSFDVAFDEASAEAKKFIEKYMVVFAGKDNTAVTEENIGVMQVSNNLKGPNDASLVKMFEIQPITAQEKGKIEAEAKANPKNAVKTICFYVEYNLNVEK